MKKIKIGIFFMLLFLFTSSKGVDRILMKDILNSKLIFIGNINKLNHNKVSFNVSKPIFSKRDKYELNYKNIWSSYRVPGSSGEYIVFAKRDLKHLRSMSVFCMFKIVGGKVLISEPYVNLLIKSGWNEQIKYESNFHIKLLINKNSNANGVKVELEAFIKIIQAIKTSKNIKNLSKDYKDGTFEKALLNN